MAGGPGKALPLHDQIHRKLQGDVSTDWLNCSIFKVPNHLRRISEQAYEPQVISIGPYHHGKGELKKMEVHKMFYLKMLLERKPEISLERYVTALKDMEEDARKFYSGPLDHIDGENFVEMMLLDGCFIIELIRKSAMKEPRDQNDHLLTHFILRRAMLDLLLVENQLPFFILSKLFKMTVMPNDEAKDFVDMAINFVSIVMPLPGSQICRPKNQDIKHLLGLLHDCSAFLPDSRPIHITCSLEDPESLEEVRSLSPKLTLNLCSSEVVRFSTPEPWEEVRFPLLKAKAEEKMAAASVSFSAPTPVTSAPLVTDALGAKKSIISLPPKSSVEVPNESKRPAPSTATEDNKRNGWQFIRSATELNEAGINFRKIEGRLFDIKFEKGLMSIPTLSINDDTESILRNLVAYEQCFKGASSKCFTDYMIFMDCLINKGKDVELLCHHGVIDNRLGDHEVVAPIFNKLLDSVLISKDDFSYAEIFIEVEKHCKRKWNLWKAILWHNYFNTPWAGISFVAAVFLLLLTVLQSVYSVLSYQFK